MSELRITDTNSVNDSKGRAFGLEGNDFIYVVGGFVVALGLYLLLNALLHVPGLGAFTFALPFFLGPLGWVVFFRHNKPEGYAADWFEQKFNGEGWSFTAQSQPRKLGP